MGLFDKKFCDICGEKIGLFGNRKLDDGNLCKECAAKLSPWFSDRRSSTVEEIRGQLEYREANKGAVANFHTTLTLGTGTKILLDEDQRKFMVTSARDLAAANPDVLDYSQITGCNVDIVESKHEMRTTGADGKQVSYNPPQYSREYDIYMVINVNHPYFDQIRFQLNNTDIKVEPYIQLAAQPMGMNRPGMAGAAARPGVQPGRPGMADAAARPGVQPARPGMTGAAARPGVQPARPGMTGTAARPGVQPGRPGMTGAAARPGMAGTAARPAAASASASAAPAPRVISSTPGDPNMNADYIRFVQMGEEIRAHLMGVRQEARDEMEAAAAPQQAVTCPWCGATTIPDASGCCEYCDGAVNG